MSGISAWLQPQHCRACIEYITTRHAVWHAPILEAVEAGLIDALMLATSDAIPGLTRLRKATRPTLVWISDDGLLPVGPDNWTSAEPLARWARAAVIHASGGEVAHYRHVVAGVLAARRLLLVDTASRFAMSWSSLVVGKPTVVHLPTDGVHPIEPAGLH